MKFLLDPGHGGMAFEYYLTPGKRSPEIPPGIYEGVYNREICKLVENAVVLFVHNFDVETIASGPINIPLAARVKFANQIYKRDRNCALISIHCNASPKPGWSSANGFAVFHKRSQALAEIVHDSYNRNNVDIRSRGIKLANFTMVNRPLCPSVLLEMGFMTSAEEVALMQRPETKEAIVEALLGAMDNYTETMIE